MKGAAMSDIGPTEPLPSAPRASAGGGASPASGPARPSGPTTDDLRVDRDRPRRGGNDLVAQARGTGGTGKPGGTATSGETEQSDDGSGLPNPVEAVRSPDNRAKLLLGIAAATVLNLLLLLAVLANVTGASYEQVVVDETPCVVEMAGGESVLYCQR
jgi:hypothetical protein